MMISVNFTRTYASTNRYMVIRHCWPWTVIRDRWMDKITFVRDAQALRMTGGNG